MNESKNTQCGIVQLQIDDLLDNELDLNQQQPALDHIRACPDCAGEYLLARSVRDAMLDMPRPEPPPELLASVLAETARQPETPAARIGAFAGLPWFRLAAPAFAALAAVAVWLQFTAPAPEETQIAAEEQYSREDLVVAIQDLKTTIRILNEITESMQIRLGDRMVSLPVFSLPALSIQGPDGGAAAPAFDGPI